MTYDATACAQNPQLGAAQTVSQPTGAVDQAVLVAITTQVGLVAGTPTRSALADALFTGSLWRLADGEYDGNQVIQRPGQVGLGDQDDLLIDAKMVDRTPGSGRWQTLA